MASRTVAQEEPTYSPWQLAGMGECSAPDSADSAGARFLLRLLSDAEELCEGAARADDVRDEISERADSAVPVYTHERWLVFVDLGAYEEDPGELGATTDDLTGCAGVALYMIAERVLVRLCESIIEDRSEDDDDDEVTLVHAPEDVERMLGGEGA